MITTNYIERFNLMFNGRYLFQLLEIAVYLHFAKNVCSNRNYYSFAKKDNALISF